MILSTTDDQEIICASILLLPTAGSRVEIQTPAGTLIFTRPTRGWGFGTRNEFIPWRTTR
jgi:hypothetical protein